MESHSEEGEQRNRRPGGTALSGHGRQVIFSCHISEQKCLLNFQNSTTLTEKLTHQLLPDQSDAPKIALSRSFLPWRAFESSQSSPYLVCHARHTTANQGGNAGVHRQSYVYVCVCARMCVWEIVVTSVSVCPSASLTSAEVYMCVSVYVCVCVCGVYDRRESQKRVPYVWN